MSKLQELREKAYELVKDNPTKIALEVKNMFNEDMQKLKRDQDYIEAGPGYRKRREDEIRDKYRKELFTVLAEQQAEYKKVAAEITKLSKEILAKSHAKPADDVEVKLFEQELQSLQTSTMLGTNAERSIDAINGIIGKYGDNPYYASVIKDNFTQLAQNVLSIDNNPNYRQQLAKVFERLEMKATSDEQKAAAESLQAYSSGEPTFYREGSIQYEAIANVIGGEHAQYLNKPTEWIDAQTKQAE